MKHIFNKLLLALCSFFMLTGCMSSEDPQPNKPGIILLKKVTTSQGDSREFLYNSQGWLHQIKASGMLALNENLQSTSEPIYDSWGRIAYLNTDGPDIDTENVYFYTSDNKLYRLDELIGDELQSYHTFAYDDKKRLAARISFYPDVNTTIPRETTKHTYTYDPATGNLTETKVYQKTAAGQEWQLTQTRKYENYDSKISVVHLTEFLFTPTISLYKNDPGKVTTTHADGRVHISTYAYEYNEQNLPVKKTVTSNVGTAVTTEYTYLF